MGWGSKREIYCKELAYTIVGVCKSKFRRTGRLETLKSLCFSLEYKGNLGAEFFPPQESSGFLFLKPSTD